jgi:acyl-CoA reductase-like NAD-dependent aldehyde dehydrogenase
MDMLTVKHFIRGRFVEPKNGGYIDSYDPSKGEVFAKIADGDKEDVDQAVRAAADAFEA